MKTGVDLEEKFIQEKHIALIVSAAIVCVIYFAIIIVILHFLRPDYNPISEPTSRYAVGQYGFLMTSAFFSMSLGSFAVVYGFTQILPKTARSKSGLTLLGIWGFGVLIAMIFPIDLEGAPQTTHGLIHRINGTLIFISLTLGVYLVSRRFSEDEKLKSIYHVALILSLMMLIISIAIFVSIASGSGFVGLYQRIYLTVFLIWFILTASQLRSLATGSG